jgi:hypothetical protein
MRRWWRRRRGRKERWGREKGRQNNAKENLTDKWVFKEIKKEMREGIIVIEKG